MRLNSLTKLALLYAACLSLNAHGFGQGDSASYVSQFSQLIANSYAAVDDPDVGPAGLLSDCAAQGPQTPSGTVTVSEASPTVIGAAELQSRCGEDNHCIVGNNVTVEIDGSLKLYSLRVRDGGTIRWNDSTQSDAETWLCTGYAVTEELGTWDMSVQDTAKRAWIYIMNNGAVHDGLRSRAFGSYTAHMSSDESHVSVIGRELGRTWSLLAEPLTPNSTSIRVMHDPVAMGWQVGDRIAVAPTEDGMDGTAQDFFITALQTDGTIALDTSSDGSTHIARHIKVGDLAALKAAEVINLSRNIIITGDDFEEVACSNSFPEAYNFGTSTQGCRCDGNRTSCTVGLNTASAHGGFTEIANVRVEKCGQRGIEGKYCLHFHHKMNCSDPGEEFGSKCVYRNNAVEFSQHRALIVHSTHNAVVDSNVFYDVRGANLYIEDGNEMLNKLTYNVGICPRGDNGCTLPGTSNGQGDTSLNQSGIYMESPNNLMVGNRMINFFNGMFNDASGGRGPVGGQVCGGNVPLGHWEGNTFSASGRFGTYLLNGNYPLQDTGQSLMTNGTTNYDNDCASYDAQGNDLGLSMTIKSHFDYGNGFVGQYGAGDIQYENHVAIDNLWTLYWKETKSMADGCSAHVSGSYYADGGALELPDAMGAFIFEDTIIDNTQLNANHHCNVDGNTGILCGAHYVLHNVETRNQDPANDAFVRFNMNNNTNSGGMFSLSPANIAAKAEGETFNFFPQAYNTVVGAPNTYLLDLPEANCATSSSLGLSSGYDNGILCEAWLTRLNFFANSGGGDLLLRIYDRQSNTLLSEANIPRRGPGDQQGYTAYVVPGDQYRYEVSLSGADIPADWIIDFGDPVITNRWGVEHLYLDVQGRNCGGMITSDHDRRFYHTEEEWNLGWGRGACTANPPMPVQDCSVIPDLTANSDSAYNAFKTVATDACSSVDCGENGVCAAQYLGSNIPVLPTYQCVCDTGFYGDNCESGTPPATPTPLPEVDGLRIEAEDYDRFYDTTDNDVDTEGTPDEGGGINVGWIDAGEWLEYDQNIEPGTYTVYARVASDLNGGDLTITVGDASVSQTFANTGGWHDFITVEVGTMTVTDGSVVRIDLNATGFNLNWIQFNSTEGTDPTPTPVIEPTPVVTPTPEIDPTPEVTPTPLPVEPTATPGPEPTATPAPEPTATPAPEPTATPGPEPTATPGPEPTSEPEPTATPAPGSDPTPDPVSDPTPTPTADAEDPAATPAPSQPTPALDGVSLGGSSGGGAISWMTFFILLLFVGRWSRATRVARLRGSDRS